ncbi:MAG: HutD family protein [Reichenbachiella sp.]|uniref:HutD/Ves family protein n=1 Tax=Reichenbachiella sp. TaxID=2184521 RepID=UPI0032990709
MTIQYLKPDPSKKISWAKGISQELFIYPPASDFQKRDFLFRISLAMVEAETSDFTPLPGIQRTLMLLKGEHTLTHKGHHTKQLFPFDHDTFQGDWQTSSLGKATNFNLMCRTGASGTLKHLKGNAGEPITCEIKDSIVLIYVYSGRVSCETRSLETGDCLVIENGNELKLKCMETSDIIQTSIRIMD